MNACMVLTLCVIVRIVCKLRFYVVLLAKAYESAAECEVLPPTAMSMSFDMRLRDAEVLFVSHGHCVHWLHF